ncbi:MAG: ABC transporter permease [Defluviitaleaceae bacterium]|nr:ABC transporter permease [Defluviitaleaceae bacterium]
MHDAWIMIKRSMLIVLRSPEAMAMAIITPFFLMVLFGTVFGNIADIGPYNYIDFIVPGIVLQSVAQGTQYTAVNVYNDMSKGIIDRFRSMPISKASVLTGHAAASIVRNTITTAVIIGTAFIVGFRPQGGFTDWLIAAGILTLFNIAISWMAILFGLLSKTPDGAIGFMFPFFILPFISSGFAPIETMPRWLRWFAEYQPMSPVIDATRNAMMDFPRDNSLWWALVWCIGITVFAFTCAVQVFKRRTV